MMYERAICWIRRDLRVADHAALAHACASAGEVAVVFVFDTTILDRLEDRDDRRITFIHDSLVELDAKLREHGSMLLVRHGDPVRELPQVVKELNADAVFFNHDYEPSARARDEKVRIAVMELGGDVHSFKDQVIYEGDEILTGQGTPFRVFTPYKNAWRKRLESGEDEIPPTTPHTPDLSRLAPASHVKRSAHPWDLKDIGFTRNTLWLEPGENAAGKRLRSFLTHVDKYRELRDYPAVDGTSGLSVHLRFGTISIRELVRQALKYNGEGARTWLDELIWREFYQMILFHFPHVVQKSFRAEYEHIHWHGEIEHFNAWREGSTGYPIVDAAMRHFRATGWMHNRLRMIVASFLTKDLLLDYKLGETWFARMLLDFDLASNNGNWQWSASTGCDAQPYFRIFNPITQSRKFDPQGTFIRAHCPELSRFSDKDIHWPSETDMFQQHSAGCIIGEDYPAPIVDHGTQRERAIAMFKTATGSPVI